MYDIIKEIIEKKNYQFSDINEKINKLWLEYQLTNDQRDELVELAKTNIDLDNEKPDLDSRIQLLSDYVMNNLENRMKALEANVLVEPPVVEEYPEWKPYDGVVNIGYNQGQKVTHKSFKWENMLSGTVNVWEPGGPGIDERYWKKL